MPRLPYNTIAASRDHMRRHVGYDLHVTAFLKRRAETGLRIYINDTAVQDIQPIAFIIPNITSVRCACTAHDKLAGHILIFHYLLRCHPTGRHPRCHFGAFTARLGWRCCPGEQPGQSRRFLAGLDGLPVISGMRRALCVASTVCLVRGRGHPEVRGIVQVPQRRNGGSPNVASTPRYGLTAGAGGSNCRTALAAALTTPTTAVLGSCKTCAVSPFFGRSLRRLCPDI